MTSLSKQSQYAEFTRFVTAFHCRVIKMLDPFAFFVLTVCDGFWYKHVPFDEGTEKRERVRWVARQVSILINRETWSLKTK